MTEAWVTLATNDGYAQGALVLVHSLRESSTTRKIHVLITAEVSDGLRGLLRSAADAVTEVDVLDSSDAENLQLIERPDLGVTFTKLQCWRLTQYTKAVFLDADTLVLSNADELFDHEELSAVADIGWPDCFNSGVFVFKPSLDTYHALLNFALTEGSFDGGDQGLLNAFFSDWFTKPAAFRLSYIYNMTSGLFYSYAAAYKKYRSSVKIVHFIGAQKPWHTGPSSIHQSEHLAHWHSVHKKHVSPHTEHVSPSQHKSSQGESGLTARWTTKWRAHEFPARNATERPLDPSPARQILSLSPVTTTSVYVENALESEAYEHFAKIDLYLPSASNDECVHKPCTNQSLPAQPITMLVPTSSNALVERLHATEPTKSENDFDYSIVMTDLTSTSTHELQRTNDNKSRESKHSTTQDAVPSRSTLRAITTSRDRSLTPTNMESISSQCRERLLESPEHRELLSSTSESEDSGDIPSTDESLSCFFLDQSEAALRVVIEPEEVREDKNQKLRDPGLVPRFLKSKLVDKPREFYCTPPEYCRRILESTREKPPKYGERRIRSEVIGTQTMCFPVHKHPEEHGYRVETPTEEERIRAWELNQPDYLGRDSFDNIQKAIDKTLQ